MQNQDLGNTQFFQVPVDSDTPASKVLSVVYEALMEKGSSRVYEPTGVLSSE